MMTVEQIRASGLPYVEGEVRNREEDVIKYMDKDTGKAAEFTRNAINLEVGPSFKPCTVSRRDGFAAEVVRGARVICLLSTFKMSGGRYEGSASEVIVLSNGRGK
jgi:hypothetical protein